MIPTQNPSAEYRVNAPKVLTPAQHALALEMMTDFELWAGHCVQIRDKDGAGLVPFKLRKVQKQLIILLEWQLARTGRSRILVPKSRQQGISTLMVIYNLWRTMYSQEFHAFVIAHDAVVTKGLFRVPKDIYTHLWDLRKKGAVPKELVPATTHENAQELKFRGLRSSLRLGTAGSKEVGRGTSLNALHGSEVAFWENAKEIVAGLVSACSGAADSTVTLESTGQPSGSFKNLVLESVKQNNYGGWIVFFISVLQDPTAVMTPPPGFTPPPEFVKFQSRYGMTDEQLYFWYYQNYRIATMNGFDPDRVHPATHREYPPELASCFMDASTDSFFPAEDVFEAQNYNTLPTYGDMNILGVDVGGEGGSADRTHVMNRQGYLLGSLVDANLEGTYLFQVNQIATMAVQTRAVAVAVDATSNRAFVTLLKQVLPKTIKLWPVNFSEKARRPWYANVRAEMHDYMRIWLASHRLWGEPQVSLPQSIALAEQMAAYSWGPGQCRKSQKGILTMTDKQWIKTNRLEGKSPDDLDAAILTFGVPDPVIDRLANIQVNLLQQSYDPERGRTHANR